MWQLPINYRIFTVYRLKDSKTLATIYLSIPSWLVWAEIECAMYFVLPKWPINQIKLVRLDRQQMLRAYCSNIHTVKISLLFPPSS